MNEEKGIVSASWGEGLKETVIEESCCLFFLLRGLFLCVAPSFSVSSSFSGRDLCWGSIVFHRVRGVERRNKPRKKHNEAEEDWSGSYRIACVPCLLWFWSCFVGGREGGREGWSKGVTRPATKKKNLRRRSTGGVSSSICESVCRRNFFSDGLPWGGSSRGKFAKSAASVRWGRWRRSERVWLEIPCGERGERRGTLRAIAIPVLYMFQALQIRRIEAINHIVSYQGALEI